METPSNLTSGTTSAPTRQFDTMDESILKMKLAFGNASLPEIFVVMVTVGYTAEKIEEMNAELTGLETLSFGQIKEHADQVEEQEKYDNKKEDVNSLFNQHRGLSRILFKGNAHARVALQLDEPNPKAYAAWNQLATNFYSQLTANPDLQLKATGVGITPAVVTAQKQGILDVQGLKESLRNESAESQEAPEIRNAAFDKIYAQYYDYMKYAKVMLAGNQLLEALGVTVKSV